MAKSSTSWLVLLLLGGALAFWPARTAMTRAQRKALYRPLFEAATLQYQLPPRLLERVAEVESNCDPAARSAAGAVGLMQIVPRWHPQLGEGGALDPARAIPYAAQLLAAWRRQYGSWTLALAAYNAGPGNLAKYNNGVPPFAETRAYIAKILPAVGIFESGVRYA